MRRLLLVLTAFLSLAAALAAPADAAWLWPVRGEVITQYRNGPDPYAGEQHRGIDIAAAVGTPVVAAAGGEVRFAGTAGSSGLTVSVRTGDGYDTSYLHLSSISVHAGAHVAGGERLGAVGTTGGRSATAPHLHFGVREAGSRYAYVDPLSLLPPALAPPPSQAPNPAPAPAPAPPAPSPAPAPRAAPAPRTAPEPGAAPRPVPAPRLAPRPAPAPGRGPRPEPAPWRPPRRAPSPHGPPRAAPAPRGAPRPINAPGRRPLPTPTSRRAPRVTPDEPRGLAPAPLRVTAAAAPRRAPPSSSSGPDFGWALACAGLLLAAGILGLSGDGRKVTGCTSARLAGALRPLLGRR